MKINKKELAMLEENGWILEPYMDDFLGKMDQYTLDVNGTIWSLTKSRELVEETIENYDCGYYVCLMTPANQMAKWVLENACDGGIWLCTKLEEAFRFVEEG